MTKIGLLHILTVKMNFASALSIPDLHSAISANTLSGDCTPSTTAIQKAPGFFRQRRHPRIELFRIKSGGCSSFQ